MIFSENRGNSSINKHAPALLRRYGGLGVVVSLHILVAYALITGLAKKTVESVIQPVEVSIVPEEVKPPPPPKMPTPPVHSAPLPTSSPLPLFIPPPEIRVPQPQTPLPAQAVTPQMSEPAPYKPTEPELQTKDSAPAPVAVGPTSPASIDTANCKGSADDYPTDARRKEETGLTRVRIEVGIDGRPVAPPVVIKTSGSKSLDKATVKLFSRCTFIPALKDGKKIQSSFDQDYEWKLE